MSEKKPTTYKDAGVDIEAADQIKRSISDLVIATRSASTLGSFGLFGGVIEIPGSEDAFVASIDGVGTKTAVATYVQKFDTLGVDLVNHCVNDILCQGASPLFFLDYIAAPVLKESQVYDIVKGISNACSDNGIVLLGGETAEMPDTYKPSAFDLVGAIVGIVPQKKLITGQGICPGDVLIGLQSSGLHTNGYSLVRKVLLSARDYSLGDVVGGLSCSLGEELLKPHRSYLRPIRAVMSKHPIKGIAHITGGGIVGNLQRIMPSGLGADVLVRDFPKSPIFSIVQREGNVPAAEMYKTFNMGVGLIIVVNGDVHLDVLAILDHEEVISRVVGTVEESTRGITLDAV